MLTLLLVAVAVGGSNLVAAVGLGVSGVDASTRWRVGLVFGAFEAGMPVVGLIIGEHLAIQLGQASRWLGGALLIGVGVVGLIGPIRSRRTARGQPVAEAAPATPHPGELRLARLLLTGLALSLDNLVIGFALGTYQTPVLVSALIIGGVSVAMSLAGLEIGARLGRWSRRRPGSRADKLGAALLIGVGIAVAAGVLS